MTLKEYFDGKPRGAKVALAKALGISKTWMSLVINGKVTPSPELSVQIDKLTGVSRKVLRPDIFA